MRLTGTNDTDDSITVAPFSSGLSLARRRSRTQRRVFALITVALLAVVLPGCGRGPQESGYQPTPYEFVWQQSASGNLTPQQAYEQEARVERTSDHAPLPPTATLWVGQTNDAAVALAQLGPGPLDRAHLAVVILERTGGASAAIGTWSGFWNRLPIVSPAPTPADTAYKAWL